MLVRCFVRTYSSGDLLEARVINHQAKKDVPFVTVTRIYISRHSSTGTTYLVVVRLGSAVLTFLDVYHETP